MKPANDTARPDRGRHVIAAVSMAIAFAWGSCLSRDALAQPLEIPPIIQPPAAERPLVTWEIRCLDDSTLKLTLLDEQIELMTPFGKLLIPASEIRRIDFGWRNPTEVDKRIEAAIVALGDAEFKQREEASLQLAEIGERAYPALLEAAKHKDLEVSRRADNLLQKLRDELPAGRLEMRPFDVIHTEHSKIAGRIAAAALKVKTGQFGEQQLKLTDARCLRAPTAVDVEPANVLPDPGSLSRQDFPLGKTLAFRVTGAQPGGHSIWGTGIYTVDSSLAAAAVHSGALRAGQTGVVRVTLLGPIAQFVGSIQNGMSSSGWTGMAGFRIER